MTVTLGSRRTRTLKSRHLQTPQASPVGSPCPLAVSVSHPSLKLSHAGVHRLHGPQPEEGQWGPQQAERQQPQRGEPSARQVPHRGHHRAQLRLLRSTAHLPEGVHGETHGHEVQVCVCVCVRLSQFCWCTFLLHTFVRAAMQLTFLLLSTPSELLCVVITI